jgi:multiple sugar transport system substrate-binding protein
MPLMSAEAWYDAARTYYTFLYASGGRLFDDAGEPIPLSENPVAVEVLDWLVKAHLEWEIMDPAGVTLMSEEATKLFLDGRLAFLTQWDYQAARANDPELSKIVGKNRYDYMPGLGPESQGTWGQGWYYGLAADTEELDAAWEIMKALGGKDWTGDYYVAKRWAKEEGLLFGYRSMFDDPEVQQALEKYFDLELLADILIGGSPMENFKEPWYLEWLDFLLVAYQDAVTGQKSSEEALQGVLDKAVELGAG